jgi:hypothetical protein
MRLPIYPLSIVVVGMLVADIRTASAQWAAERCTTTTSGLGVCVPVPLYQPAPLTRRYVISRAQTRRSEAYTYNREPRHEGKHSD